MILFCVIICILAMYLIYFKFALTFFIDGFVKMEFNLCCYVIGHDLCT